MGASSHFYLKAGTGAAWAGQSRVAADLQPLSKVVTLSSEGNRGAEPPTGSGQANISEVMGGETDSAREGGRDLLTGSRAKVRLAAAAWLDQSLNCNNSSRVAHPSIQVKEKQDPRIAV